MKTIIFILLIISFILPFGGTFIVLQIQKQLIKEEIKHRIIAGVGKNELVILRFTKKESENKLKWEGSAEFEFNGEMYDVVSSETSGDTAIYWCWRDRAETKLNKRLNSQATKAAEQNPWNQENLKRITTFLQSLDSPSEFNFNPFTNSKFGLMPQIDNYYTSNCVSPPIPPP